VHKSLIGGQVAYCLCGTKFLAAVLLGVTSTTPAVGGGTYPLIEASFNLTGLATDPFDYAATDVRVQITQPDTSTVLLPAFFNGGSTWKVRHTPALPGAYKITGITLNGASASYTSLQPTNWLVSGFPTGAGFVRRDPTNARRFITSNGRRYFPVGHNVAWSAPAANAGTLFAKMGTAHENWSRVWMTHFYAGNGLGLNLDWPKVNGTFGQLSLTVAQNWDAIVTAADQAGLHFQMTMQHHGQYSTTVDPDWPDNPYSTANGGFLSSAASFFTDATAKAYTKRKLRYSIARWGYSPAIMSWELFNEVQFTDAAQANQWANIQAWHNEMAAFLRAQDPYQHLITTSSDLTQPIWDQTDYYQHHEYPDDLIAGVRDSQDINASQPAAPDFIGEVGIDTTPHLGISPPVWAGLMSGQSGGAMPWYWDTIDPNNDYFLIQAAADFVTVSGLADQNTLAKSSPRMAVPGGVAGALVFVPGGGWGPNSGPDTFVVGSTTPDGIALSTDFLQGNGNRSLLTNGYTFFVNYPSNGTFSVLIDQVSSCGGTLQILLDGALLTNVTFPGNATCGSSYTPYTTNRTYQVNVTAGLHTIKLANPGTDWLTLRNITLNPYAYQLAAYAVGNTNFTAMWLWHRTNVFAASPGPSVRGTVDVGGLSVGAYSGVWWDTFGGGAVSSFAFSVTNASVPVTVSVPTVLRSLAFYAGRPARAAIVAPNLSQTATTNTPSFNLPLVITNSGGLPLAYSLSTTSALPAWLAFSGTNGTVPASGSIALYLGLNPAALSPGAHQFTLFVNTSDPSNAVTALTVTLTIPPAAPRLLVLAAAPGQFVFRLLGDAGVPFVLQTSPDLAAWTAVSTNTLAGGGLNITNPVMPAPSPKFWRALWEP
jgi:hypothetical protein